jgi:hypothetical protein
MPIDANRRAGGAAGPIQRLLVILWLLWACAAQAQSLESVLAPGDLIQGHAKVEHECNSCHSRFDRAAQDRLCISCHKEVGADLRQHAGWHGRHEPRQQCRACHTDHKGRNAQVASFDLKTFDHRTTDFELRDKHSAVECAKCHQKGKRWREAASTCVSCHTRDDVHKGGLGPKCEDCHNARNWRETEFDHGKKTRFALADKHAEIKCVDCHARNRYKDTPRTCIGCHRKDDEHKGRYGEKCESCHGAKTWKPSSFSHDADTHYALKHKHRDVKCAACHTGPLYRQKLGTACIDCHAKDDKHQDTLGRKCAACHTERGWKDTPAFDHAKSRFPLLGAHAKVQCKDCHSDPLYRKTPSTCLECHRKVDKHQGTLGTACADCHLEQNWKTVAGRFDHERTKFPLRNAHAARTVKCQDCHETLIAFRKTPMQCVSCHRRDDRHEGTSGERCEQCHRDVNWRVERYDHSKNRYPLAGRHLVVPCGACHLSRRYKEAASDCFSCHRKDDKHKASLGPLCAECHNVRAWSLWDFDHDRKTTYRLEGKHRKVPCDACHTRPAPAGKAAAPLSSECQACHRKDDVHEGGFSRRCELCHGPADWRHVRQATVSRPAPAGSAAGP